MASLQYPVILSSYSRCTVIASFLCYFILRSIYSILLMTALPSMNYCFNLRALQVVESLQRIFMQTPSIDYNIAGLGLDIIGLRLFI